MKDGKHTSETVRRERDVLSPDSLGRPEALALTSAVLLAITVALGWFDPMLPWSG